MPPRFPSTLNARNVLGSLTALPLTPGLSPRDFPRAVTTVTHGCAMGLAGGPSAVNKQGMAVKERRGRSRQYYHAAGRASRLKPSSDTTMPTELRQWVEQFVRACLLACHPRRCPRGAASAIGISMTAEGPKEGHARHPRAWLKPCPDEPTCSTNSYDTTSQYW